MEKNDRIKKLVLGILVLCLAVLFSGTGSKKQMVVFGAFLVFGICNLAVMNSKNTHNREAYQWMMTYAQEHFERHFRTLDFYHSISASAQYEDNKNE